MFGWYMLDVTVDSYFSNLLTTITVLTQPKWHHSLNRQDRRRVSPLQRGTCKELLCAPFSGAHLHALPD